MAQRKPFIRQLKRSRSDDVVMRAHAQKSADGNRRIRHGDLVYLDNYARYDLPKLPRGQRYAVADKRIVVIDAENYQILQMIQVFKSLTN